ncbi:MAG TPA: cyanophycinase, partial [Terriglobales bacterium]|nr:cyanophycinase [Terriglobales bacterium]
QKLPYQYIRLGAAQDVAPKAAFGVALMGGGSDQDEAFRWLCGKGSGGDFLILRARGDDSYNPYIKELCHVNSVATLIIPNRAAAQEPAVAEIIRTAEVIFIAGGDQANYTRNWKDTPVDQAMNAHIAAGKPIGGTSAGLAVLGEYVYSAEGDKPDDADLRSSQVLMNPFDPRVALRRDFLRMDLLQNTITDSHFAKRDRMGRSLGFLARIVSDGWSSRPREIAIDEKSVVLVEASGQARVVGSGKGAYFLSVEKTPEVCRPATPLTFRDISVYHAPAGSEFDLKQWRGTGGNAYSLSVVAGSIQSTQPNQQIY